MPEAVITGFLSSSLPIFQLNRIDDKLFLDGMFFDNMPISLLKQKRYESFSHTVHHFNI